MREIKFRGKRLDNREWVFGYFSMNDENGKCYITNQTKAGGAHPWQVIPETVGQFTGLHDKNGKEIYEGDIITNLYGDIGVVIWKERITSFVCSLNLVSFKSVNWDKCVIIGNIHDNPELIHDKTAEVEQ